MLGGLGFPEILIIILWIVVLGFVVVMLSHAISNKRLPIAWRVLWAVAFCMFHFFTAVVYYFYCYRSSPQGTKSTRELKSEKS